MSYRKSALVILLLLAAIVFPLSDAAADNEASLVTYRVNVINGYAEPTYASAGERVYIYGRTPSSWNNYYFDYWYSESSGVIFDNKFSRNTSFIMPNHAVTVGAEYRTYGWNNGFTVGGGCSSTAPAMLVVCLPLALLKLRNYRKKR